MGILFEKVMLSKEGKRQFIIKELIQLRVTEDDDGTSVEQLDYYQLRHLLAMEKAKMG
ncbi:hypothetical protein [Bacillus sp. 03113]|uniref:hypothetical protein n=1 Tax=Bacillus sp. 03113 TaxID=2578211 RepID=UPI0015E87E92|nr:hypothetical protein [Bacillus sp. 03113]